MIPSVGSCFSGIGGLDLAFERAGAHIEWTSEVDASASRVLRYRFPRAQALGDIVALVDGMFPPPEVDVIIGGPPCQDLSTANASGRVGLAGSRSGLFHAFATLLERLAPSYVVMEQVPGLLTANDGADLLAVVDRFDVAGYRMDWRRRDTRSYGPPQRRERLTLVAVRQDLCAEPGHLLDAADPVGTHSSISDLIDFTDYGEAENFVSADVAASIISRLDRPGGAAPAELRSALEAVVAGSPITSAARRQVWRKSTRARSAEVGETWVLGTHSNTLTLNDVGAARATMLVSTSSGTLRTLSPVEGERLHGFPDGWTEPAGAYRRRMARLGNAVSVPVGEAIARAVVAAMAEPLVQAVRL